MNNFLANLINRHMGAGQRVLPRARGRFESDENHAAVVLAPHTRDKSHQLRPVSISPEKKLSEDERPDPSHTRQPVNDQREPNLKSIEATDREIVETDYYNASPEPAYPSVLETSAGVIDEHRTSAPVRPVQESIQQQDKVSDYQTADHKANIKTGSDDTVHKAVAPSMTTHEKGHPITHDKPGSPIFEVPKNTHKNLLDQRTNKRQTLKSKPPSNRSIHLAEQDLNIFDTQPDSLAMQNTNAGTSTLLEIPASLSQQQIESAGGLSIKGKKEVNESVIKVTIGRIDVRAVTQQAPKTPRRSLPTKPKMSLDDYLKNRSGGQP